MFWTAFDMPVTGVPLEVALGWHKFYFWVFQKIIMQVGVKCDIMIIFLKCPKIKFVHNLESLEVGDVANFEIFFH